MALEVLHNFDNPNFKQKPAHDLESIFFVLLYILLVHKGPGDPISDDDTKKAKKYFLRNWFMAQNTRDAYGRKKIDLEEFQSGFIDHLSPYFSDLGECLWELFDILFEPQGAKEPRKEPLIRSYTSNTVTHDQMLDILRRYWQPLPDRDTYASQNKRK
jgi:hypothetical protein